MEKIGFSLEGRVLCSDESCIGTVGPDGKCKECGLEYQGDEPLDFSGPTNDAEDDLGGDNADEPGKTGEPSGEAAATDPDERVCCPDETCIGIIGPNGKCGTCGKAG